MIPKASGFLFLVLVLSLVLVPGCSSAPETPIIDFPILYHEANYEEAGGILPEVGTLELKIDRFGAVESTLKRKLLVDIERKGRLTAQQADELSALMRLWTERGAAMPSANGSWTGRFEYNGKVGAWEKGASLSPEMSELARFFHRLPPTIPKIRIR